MPLCSSSALPGSRPDASALTHPPPPLAWPGCWVWGYFYRSCQRRVLLWCARSVERGGSSRPGVHRLVIPRSTAVRRAGSRTQRQGLLLRLCLLCSSETHVLEALIQAQMKAVEGSKRIQRLPVNGRYLLNRIPLRQKRTTSSANVSAWGFFCCSTANPRPWSATSQRWTLHSG